MVMLCLLHGLTLYRGLHQVPSTAQDCEGGCWKTTSSNRILHHATQEGEPSLGCKKISVTISPPLTSGHLTPWIVISFIIMSGAVQQVQH